MIAGKTANAQCFITEELKPVLTCVQSFNGNNLFKKKKCFCVFKLQNLYVYKSKTKTDKF